MCCSSPLHATWHVHARMPACRSKAPGVAFWLDQQGVDFIQFAFRWVNCLLVRELPFVLGIRLWDTYIAEGSGFNEFLVRGGARRGGHACTPMAHMGEA